MSGSNWFAVRLVSVLLVAVIAAAPVAAQDSSNETSIFRISAEEQAVPDASAARIAAGVRNYPARVIRSLLQLAEDPLVLRQLADEPDLLEHPEKLSPPASAELLDAIRELSGMPMIVDVAASYPAELAALREMYKQTPVETEEKILRLRSEYDRAEVAAAAAWQETLKRDRTALEDYARLVTQFCREQRAAYADFPCVEARQLDYYLACPPNEAIVLYAIDQGESSAARTAIEQWWEANSPYEHDARILGSDPGSSGFSIFPALAAYSPEQRASMWSATGGADSSAVELVPVIMQPPGDQPPGARYAYAVAEHARLWSPETPTEASDETADAGISEAATESAPRWESPGYVASPTYETYGEPYETYSTPVTTYTSTTYYPRSYAVYQPYYTPIVTYYAGYPYDWPVFYRCEPDWLVRYRICSTYRRCGPLYYPWHGRPSLSVNFNFGGRDGHHRDYTRNHDRGVIRFGSRDYSRCSREQIVHALRDHRVRRGGGNDYARFGFGRTGSGERPDRTRHSEPDRYQWHDRTERPSISRYMLSTPGRATPFERPRTSTRDGVSSRHSTSTTPRFLNSPRTTPRLHNAPSSSSRNSNSSSTIARFFNSPSTTPRFLNRPSTARGISNPSRRGEQTRPELRPSPRSRSGSAAKNAPSPRIGGSDRRSSPARGSNASPRQTVNPGARRIESARANESSRSTPRISSRPQSSPKPKSSASAGRGGDSRRGSGVSGRRSTNSGPRSTPARTGGGRSSRGSRETPRRR